METYLLFISEWIGGIAVAMIAGTSAKFTRVKLMFKYPRREGVVALGIFLLTLFLAFVLASVPPLSISGLPDDLRAFFEKLTDQPLELFKTKHW